MALHCRRSFLAGVILLAALLPGQESAPAAWEVVVYGGTSGGVAAAVQAALLSRRVLLIESGRHLGGMSSSGLGATDIGNKDAIGGLAREFYRRVRRHYDDDRAWRWEERRKFQGRGHQPGEDTAWTFEPHVAEAVFEALVREAGVEVWRGERLDLARGVVKTNGRISLLRLESGREARGLIFIDASYEGDLMALAGVSYTIGRESNQVYGETLNGVQTNQATHHQFTKEPDPFVEPGNPASGLLPGIQAGGPGVEGSADRRIQAYCFRICATDAPENRVPWPKPPGYDPARYELLLRNFEAGDFRSPWHPVAMPNRKTDSNNNFAVSTDFIGGNHGYPEGDYAARESIVAAHREWQQGLLWTLANDARVPAKVRAEFKRWGLARDEFADNGHWPRQLYIREARRLVGPYVMTEGNCRGLRQAEDPVGLGAYGMDSHHVQRYVASDGRVWNEGDVQVHGFSPYGISYRALTPRREECANLLVPVCLSASHIAYGSIRMEPVFMVLGHSAATAADLALERGVGVQEVPYGELRRRLEGQGQVVEWVKEMEAGGKGGGAKAAIRIFQERGRLRTERIALGSLTRMRP